MLHNDETLRALRSALAVSPENMALRRHLAELLVSAGKPQEAVDEYRQALGLSPRDDSLRLPLARLYMDLGNDSAALVIIEEVLKQRSPPPAAYLTYARLLLNSNQPDRAAHAYRQAVTEDPSLADADLAGKLEINSKTGQSREAAEFDDDDDRRVRLHGGDDDDGDEQLPTLDRPTITFADIGGMETLKEEIRLKILHPLAHPDLYKMYGKSAGGGILMYGPPGCGKTYLARATAGEAKAGFLAVGIEDVLDMWLGNSERRLHELFEIARRNKPCMLFFDEVDALGAKRSDMRTSATRMLVNQFLSELDGVSHNNDGVLILAATNAPWHVDAAFRRPGRVDRILFVPPPDAAAREDILRLHLKGRPLGEIDYRAIAAKTDQFSGADLKAVIDRAVEAKLTEAMKTGRPVPVITRDLLAAAKQHRPTTKEWFGTARNYAVYSNQDGTYDDILRWLKIQ